MNLLQMNLLTEPDLQRFARFALEIASSLGANRFVAAAELPGILEKLRKESLLCHGALRTDVRLDGNMLVIASDENTHKIETIPKAPAPELVLRLNREFTEKSVTADPDLLRLQNIRIRQDLKKAKARAEKDLAEFEALLRKKKDELRIYMRKAETDDLTGLLNRGAYDTRLFDFIKRRGRDGRPLTLIFLDMDNFKKINDTLGHDHGDRILKKLARTMRNAVRRDIDFICRIGGDEFAILLFSETSIAKRVASKILDSMDGKVSIGIAAMSSGDTPKSLAKRADEALYEAKERGRGRFYCMP